MKKLAMMAAMASGLAVSAVSKIAGVDRGKEASPLANMRNASRSQRVMRKERGHQKHLIGSRRYRRAEQAMRYTFS